MGKVDVTVQDDYGCSEVAIYDAVKPAGGSALAADLRYNTWLQGPEGKAWQARNAERIANDKEARRLAQLAETYAILERARARQANETTAVVETAEVANGQATQVERVVGTV